MIDEIDKEILAIVQRDGRMTQRELGRAVGLSPNAAGARLQRLIDRGVIVGFTTVVDHEALGRPIEASVDVWVTDDGDRQPLIDLVAADDRIVEGFHLTGPLDYRLRCRVSSTDDLNELLQKLRDEGNVRQTDTRLVLEQLPTAPTPG